VRACPAYRQAGVRQGERVKARAKGVGDEALENFRMGSSFF